MGEYQSFQLFLALIPKTIFSRSNYSPGCWWTFANEGSDGFDGLFWSVSTRHPTPLFGGGWVSRVYLLNQTIITLITLISGSSPNATEDAVNHFGLRSTYRCQKLYLHYLSTTYQASLDKLS